MLGVPLVVSGDAEREDDDDDVDGDDFILTSSASRAGAKVLTTVSRSDWFDKDWRAKRPQVQKRFTLWWVPSLENHLPFLKVL